MRARGLLLALPLAVVGLLLVLAARDEQARERPPLEAQPADALFACAVCRAAHAVDLRMTPFEEVRRWRCGGKGGVLWPRGRVRAEDVSTLVLVLDVDQLHDLEDDEVELVFHSGLREIESRSVPLVWLIDDYYGTLGALQEPGPEAFLASRLSRGARLEVPASVRQALRTGARQFQARLRHGQFEIVSPWVRIHTEHVESRERRAAVRDASAHLPSWIQLLLEAQVLFEHQYFMAASEQARAVLRLMPNEPHAVALIYASHLRAGFESASTDLVLKFAEWVQEPIRAMRGQLGTSCDLEISRKERVNLGR